MHNTIEEYLQFFKENKVSIQITLDNNDIPTVHAFIGKEGQHKDLHKTQSHSLIFALDQMLDKYNDLMEDQ